MFLLATALLGVLIVLVGFYLSRSWRHPLRIPAVLLGAVLASGGANLLAVQQLAPPPSWSASLFVSAGKRQCQVLLQVGSAASSINTITVRWHAPRGVITPPNHTYGISGAATWSGKWVIPLGGRLRKAQALAELSHVRLILIVHGAGKTQRQTYALAAPP
jgi:hypothetical protein